MRSAGGHRKKDDGVEAQPRDSHQEATHCYHTDSNFGVRDFREKKERSLGGHVGGETTSEAERGAKAVRSALRRRRVQSAMRPEPRRFGNRVDFAEDD